MKHLIMSLTALGAVISASYAYTAAEKRVSREQQTDIAPTEKFEGFVRKPAKAESSLQVDFTAGESSAEPVKTFTFDDGLQGWTPDAAQNVSWTTKAGTNSFSSINPSSVASLYVDGPYQTFKRETSHIVSPKVDIPSNGSLSFYAGFSLNYNDVCSLVLSISTDGFDTSAVLWNSVEEQGEKPFAWRPINIDLSEYAGKSVQFRFTYGPGTDDMFQTGGYLADYYIDDFVVSGRKTIDSVAVATGEVLKLVPMIKGGEAQSYKWSLPGATPSESTDENPEIYYTSDGEYDITLTVTDAKGAESSKTRSKFVKVTGTSPVARIVPPATFRYSTTRLPMVAPMVPVTWMDGSEGYPSEWSWTFTGVDADNEKIVTSTEQNPTVRYAYLHKQTATLEATNQHGSSTSSQEVSVEYYGVINNLEPSDGITTFDMEDWGYFPGSNTRNITAYAEKFSKPSRPIVINGVYAYFTRTDAGELVDQISSVGVHVCKSENGLPGEKLESWWWDVVDLDGPSAGGDVVGTAFPITPPVVVDDEFFIMIDGIPSYKEATQDNGATAVTLGMAAFRDHGNTAYMLKDNKWVDVSTYFPAGANHTSLMLYPSIIHSVMAPVPYSEEPIKVKQNAGTVDYPIFSIMGWDENVQSDAEWLRVTNKPNEMTLDTLKIEYDALPENLSEREGTLTLSDGVTELQLKVIQNKDGGSGVASIEADGLKVYPTIVNSTFTVEGVTPGEEIMIFNIQGVKIWSGNASDLSVTVDASGWLPGIYLLRTSSGTARIVKR